MNNILFRPVQGKEKNILELNKQDGNIYFATDTGKIYIDAAGQRIPMGGSGGAPNGASVFYGSAEELEEQENELYHIEKIKVDGIPRVNDLILNADGGFYKVIDMNDEFYICTLLSVSGTGGNTPSVEKIPVITKMSLDKYSVINGSEAYVELEANSFFVGENPIDYDLRVLFSLGTKNNPNDDFINTYWSTTEVYKTGQEGYFEKYGVGPGYIKDRIEIGTKLRDSSTSYLVVQVLAGNHDGPSRVRGMYDPITTSVLELKHVAGYDPSTRQETSGFNVRYNVNGAIDKKIKFTFDGVEIKPNGEGSNTEYSSYKDALWTPVFSIPAGRYDAENNPVLGTATHGYHTIEVQLCQMLGNSEGSYVKPLRYEIAVVGNDATLPPVIWLGDYKDVYYTYDSIQIPFFVWDPEKTTSATNVHLYKDGIELEGSPLEIREFKEYNYWEIADADFGQQNKYQISCGESENRRTTREIRFTIEKDPIRDMVPEQTDLMLDFNATGRTNSESATKRQNWSYKLKGETKSATFTNFNWSNNGWAMDKTINTSYLCISNGARLTIPYQEMIFASNSAGQQSHSVEMQFKVRNIQKYEKLISNITRYKFGTAEDAETDEVHYQNFNKQKDTGYDNYDAYLQYVLSPEDYELLTYWKVEKIINTNNIVGGLYDYDPDTNTVTGFCIGTQDAFFSNGTDTVNIDFVENELINISFVYQDGLKLLYIYINGCITGVIKSTHQNGGVFKITSKNFVFDSTNCDFDLYKIRVYSTDLNVNQIVKNFAADRRDVNIFDQNGLAIENDVLQEYQLIFSNVQSYIENNPDKPLMPYIIFDTGNKNSMLPYSKKDKKYITVEFVNVPLEQAYTSGKLEALASKDGLITSSEPNQEQIDEAVKTYYKHHCPSFTTKIRTNDKVNFEVQGTSSEFYPRRNYKIKTKMEGNFNWKNYEDFTESEKSKMKPEDLQKLEEDGGKFTKSEKLNLFMNRGPFAADYKNDSTLVSQDPHKIGYESTRLSDGWYMNNYTNPTDRWTMKVDYMESSGSYNAGFASLVGNSYTKHPLQDYLKVMTNTSLLKPIVDTSVCDDDGMRWEDYRTSLLGFPVMAFWKRIDEEDNNREIYTFIGYYRMLLDKSSTQVLGFKTPKDMRSTLVPESYKDDGTVDKYKRMRDVAECWEFSNNARGYCSFRDPWKRVELSFKPPVGVKNEYTTAGAPIVANSFEYRYHCKDDFIDKLYDFDAQEQDSLNEVAEELDLAAKSITLTQGDRTTGTDALLTTYANWEKVCKWLWSTNLDAVTSQGTYNIIPVGNVLYKDNGTFYIIDNNGEYQPSTAPFDKKLSYYIVKKNDKGEIEYADKDKTQPLYEPVDATTSEYLYTPGKFYYVAGVADDGENIYAISNDGYDGSIDYFEFIESDEETLNKSFDLLIAPVDTKTEIFDSEGPIIPVLAKAQYNNQKEYFTKAEDGSWKPWTYESEESYINAVNNGLYYRDHYYTWHGTDYNAYDSDACVTIKPGQPTNAVRVVAEPDANEWKVGLYYKAAPVTYVNQTYTHDTREYRVSKFTNEFTNYFDPEYVATYFIMTEVMECYDSRGKNCMMASWGPHKPGGEYIWYPIFYDIDTQLGINNTGIPSFEFNVDATDENNFSTSDSILWNNFYKFFKQTWIIPKYQNLRKIDTNKFKPLLERNLIDSKAPLQSVDYIEQWYNFDPKVTHNLACEGEKPLIATNLDLYFKYITITNENAKACGVAHLDDAGSYAKPDDGTYFYALQGDRSQSRRQFLTNRLEYIDSWLTQKNYSRGGTNRLWGRISANNTSGEDVHSDKWVENRNNPYWLDKEFGTKAHEFDAEYWLELKPIRSSYVTAGDDSANYPSEKYDGQNKMHFVLDELENGIRTSNNYPEQLLYIYGTNQMSDFGDLSKMYWTEFKLEGEADKLTRLKLGHDGLDENDQPWYNRKLNNVTLPNLPLLKEANFCNINITADKKSLDLSGSEKLENFRATGSNFNSISFAKGVALNTLYLPSTITSLALDRANLLTDLITEYKTPDKVGTDLVATRGLYLESFFEENGGSALKTIDLKAGSLGYNSFTILKQLCKKNSANITMQEVNWCPYTKLTEGDIYEEGKTYYKDNGHYGLEKYPAENETYNSKQFNAYVLSGLMYRDDGFGGRKNNGKDFSDLVLSVDDSAITLLKNIYELSDKYFDSSTLRRPDITGIIYINNTVDIDEGTYSAEELEQGKIGIGNLQQYYPNLTFFFTKVNKAYSAKFVIFNEEDYSEKFVKWADGNTSPSVQKIQAYNANEYFSSPFDLYIPKKEHYDFVGWSLNNYNPYDEDGNLLPDAIVITEKNKEDWFKQKLDKDISDYTYYAIFTIHNYQLTFYNDDGTKVEKVLDVPYGERAYAPLEVPYKDDPTLDFDETYSFQGYSLSIGGNLVDLSTIVVSSNEEFYTNYTKMNIYKSKPHEEWFNIDDDGNIYPSCILKGKVLLPLKVKGKDVVGISSLFSNKIDGVKQQFTHIFCQKDSKITQIQYRAFYQNEFIKYFDYSPNTITTINPEAFRECNNLDLGLFKLSNKLKTIGNYGFANSFVVHKQATKPMEPVWTITIPNSVKYLGQRSFSNIITNGAANKPVGNFIIGDGNAQSDFSLYIEEEGAGLTTPTQTNPIIRLNFTYSAAELENAGIQVDSNYTYVPIHIILNKTKYTSLTAEEKLQLCSSTSTNVNPLDFQFIM